MDMDISMNIHEKSVDMDMDVIYHIHGNPGNDPVYLTSISSHLGQRPVLPYIINSQRLFSS